MCQILTVSETSPARVQIWIVRVRECTQLESSRLPFLLLKFQFSATESIFEIPVLQEDGAQYKCQKNWIVNFPKRHLKFGRKEDNNDR